MSKNSVSTLGMDHEEAKEAAIDIVLKVLETLDQKNSQQGTATLDTEEEMIKSMKKKLRKGTLKGAWPFNEDDMDKLRKSDDQVGCFRDLLVATGQRAKRVLPGKVSVTYFRCNLGNTI